MQTQVELAAARLSQICSMSRVIVQAEAIMASKTCQVQRTTSQRWWSCKALTVKSLLTVFASSILRNQVSVAHSLRHPRTTQGKSRRERFLQRHAYWWCSLHSCASVLLLFPSRLCIWTIDILFGKIFMDEVLCSLLAQLSTIFSKRIRILAFLS